MSESESNRILDLDDDGAIEVHLANRNFTLRQQRRAVLEKVLKAIYPDKTPRQIDEKATMRELAEFSSEAWAEALPTFALILGVEETDANYKETVAHLEEHLTFPKARRIFEAWWKLNRVEDFFFFAGNPLIPEDRLTAFLEQSGAANGAPIEEPTLAETSTSSSTT